MEDAATGFLIQRFGTVGEDPIAGPAFQIPGDNRIRIPIGASIPGKVTTRIDFTGQLDASASGPTQRVVSGMTLSASGNPVTTGTLLNDLDSTLTPYAAGDQLNFIGQHVDGTQFSSPVAVDGTTTIQDLLDHLSTVFGTTATASLQNSSISIQAAQYGPSALNIRVEDDSSNVGGSNAAFVGKFSEDNPGHNASTQSGSIPIHDERGAEHALTYDLVKEIDGSWTMTFGLDGNGSLLDNQISGIRFGPDGSLTQVSGTGDGDSNISLFFNSSTIAQTIDIDLGTLGTVDGLAENGPGRPVSYVADGFSPGELASVQIDVDGTMSGIASNGIKFDLAQLAIAAFRNPDGLNLAGSGYYKQSLASGGAEIGTALSGDRGAIRAGQLEGSNVDLALEFTRLLVAQRGFSANARTITVTDEVLEELTNIIR